MKTIQLNLTLLFSSLALLSFASTGVNTQQKPSNLPDSNGIRNIVLVHGAFVNAAGWQPVFEILTRSGFNVEVVQHPLTSFQDDLDAVNRTLSKLDGPCILVGHSYGGVLISEAGNAEIVKGLVYIAAHAPDSAEARAVLFARYPSPYKSLIKGADGFDYIEPSKFAADFAADLPPGDAQFLAKGQFLTADKVFQATITNPAWKKKKSWYVVAGSDRIINPDLERMYARRASSHTIELEGASHAVYISRPKEVAALIMAAAKTSAGQ